MRGGIRLPRARARFKENAMSLTRRRFFTQSGLIAAGSIASPHFVEGREPRKSSAKVDRPSHIIHLVSDGMSSGTLMCGDALSKLRRGRGSAWIELYNNPNAFTGLMDMRSLNSLVTDSSAASSSWGCGSRINNGAVNVLPDGRELKPIYSLFAEQGWKRGLVTTTEITHATPAGFAANDASRGSAETIAAQYLDRRVDVLLGGGAKFFNSRQRGDKRDLLADYQKAGYATFETAAEMHQARDQGRWLGLFASGHLPYTVDHMQNPELRVKVPSLADMTGAALRRLGREEHFILQVEGGRVDHGAHNCDAAAALYDQIAFEEAIEVCLAFQEAHPDTLIVITTDHGNGNLALNGIGDGYAESSQRFANLNRIKASFGELTPHLKKGTPLSEIRQVLGDYTGYKVEEGQAALLADYIEGRAKPLFGLMNSLNAQLGQLLGNYTGVSFTSGAHTADYVPVLAMGPGAERFRGFIKNTDVFHHYLDLARIDFKNPTMPLQASITPPQSEENVHEYIEVAA